MNLNKFIKNFQFNNVNFESLNFFTKDKNCFNLYLKVLENRNEKFLEEQLGNM
jgi:hypothetical protein